MLFRSTAQIRSICLAGLKCKSNSCYSLVHILSVSSAKSVPIPSVFFCDCEVQNNFFEIQSRAHFANFTFQNCSDMLRYLQFFCDFDMQIELSLQSCPHFADLIFQKCSGRDRFLTFEVPIELSQQSGAHFSDLLF